ncbi:MAG TPA: hypothetical protein VE623_00025 [Acidimicrobiales bacterium]|jgi:NADPH:quinone reductase-like Zn-dependent oxidoreductase|nr:hypothetical protein [Acidimicrobiales bacterium]
MKAIVVTDQAAGTAGMKLVERPEPQAARLASLSGASYGDVVVEVHASGFAGDELTRRSTSERRSSSTSTTTPWKTSAESIWFSMSLAATSGSGPQA